MSSAKLKAAQRDPRVFRRSILIDAGGEATLFNAVADQYQLDDFGAVDDACRRLAGHPIEPTHTRAWLERPRGHSKTTDIALIVIWLLFASARKLSIVVAAGDQEQASLLRDAVDGLTRLNPWLSKFISVQRTAIINPHTGSVAAVLSSDAATSYGLTPDVVVCDELTHWKRRDLWDSLFSSAAKRANALLLVITNAGYRETWQWELREAVRQDPRWYFHALAGPVAKWITADRLDEQRRLLPSKVYSRLWLNQWASGSGDALEEADILASVTQPAPLSCAENGWVYIAALDLGLTRDASALIVLGRHVGYSERIARPRSVSSNRVMSALNDLGYLDSREPLKDFDTIYHSPTGRLKVASLRLWRPQGGKVSVEEIENEIMRLNRAFGLACVAYDPWQAEYLAERLQKQNIKTEPTPFVPQNLQSMAQTMMEQFGNRLIDIYPDADLIADLRALRIVEKSYGIRLDSPRGSRGHGDAATALAIGQHAIKRFSAPKPASRIEHSLVLHPSAN